MTRKVRTTIRTWTSRLAAGALAFAALVAGPATAAAQPSPDDAPRLALVIGESAYKTDPLPSAANDAGLIADTLQRAGFDVTGAADLDQDGLRKTLREFVEKAIAAGPDATVFIYLAGRGLQFEGHNFLAPVDATIPNAASAPLEAVRLSDYLGPLAQAPLRARIVVLDAARMNNFARSGPPLAGGLALVEPPPGALYAFNAAPGAVAPPTKGPYGVYAKALTEMLSEGGLPLDQAFARARLRVAEETGGAQVPWDESKLAPAPILFARAPGAPAMAFEAPANLRARPIRDYPVAEAFNVAVEIDTIDAYEDFLHAYPHSAYARRARVMLALRREALTWRRAVEADTPRAYWTYLRRYPRGPHAADARRRLAFLRAALNPPESFEVYDFDVPPPVESEEVYIDRPYVVFDDRDYGPPPPVEYLLPRRHWDWDDRPPPPPPHVGLLPLVAAPLLYALPAARHGHFHAPAVVRARVPEANKYYREHARHQPFHHPGAQRPGQPNGAAAPVPGMMQMQHPTPHAGAPHPAGPNGAALPHPGAMHGGQHAPNFVTPHPAGQNGAAQPHPGAMQRQHHAPNFVTPHPAGKNGAPLPHPGAMQRQHHAPNFLTPHPAGQNGAAVRHPGAMQRQHHAPNFVTPHPAGQNGAAMRHPGAMQRQQHHAPNFVTPHPARPNGAGLRHPGAMQRQQHHAPNFVTPHPARPNGAGLRHPGVMQMQHHTPNFATPHPGAHGGHEGRHPNFMQRAEPHPAGGGPAHHEGRRCGRPGEPRCR